MKRMIIRPLALALLSAVFATLAQAQADYVVASGKLSDTDFHRLVACGASPGGDCQFRPVRWNARDARNLTVGFISIDAGIPTRYMRKSRQALTQAVSEINGAKANLRMFEVSDRQPLITIRMHDSTTGPLIEPSDDWGSDVFTYTAAAYFRIQNKGTRITGCAIAVGTEMRIDILRRVFLEEIVQCLGLPFDIQNKYYRRKSIFAQLGFGQNRLKGQDQSILRLHYPFEN